MLQNHKSYSQLAIHTRFILGFLKELYMTHKIKSCISSIAIQLQLLQQTLQLHNRRVLHACSNFHLNFKLYVLSDLMGHVVKLLTVSSNAWIMYSYQRCNNMGRHHIVYCFVAYTYCHIAIFDYIMGVIIAYIYDNFCF